MDRERSWVDDDDFVRTGPGDRDYLSEVTQSYRGREQGMGLALRRLLVRTGYLPPARRSGDTTGVSGSCLQTTDDLSQGHASRQFVGGVGDIRKLRTELGLSQRKFAQRYYFDLYVLKSWEAGRRSPDRANTLLLRLIALDPKGMADRIKACRASDVQD